MDAETIKAQRQAVIDEAHSWLRTPYHHQGAVKGVGVDCAMILVEVYKAVGLIPADLDPRPYPVEWHLHRDFERYLGWLDIYATRTEDPKPGDISIFKFGRCFSHSAIIVAEHTVIHSYLKQGVVLESTLHEPLAGREVVHYTLWSE